MTYPIIFRPIYKKMIWGSESWDISCRPLEMGVIENGPRAGQTFADYIAESPEAALGTRWPKNKRFPLLVKLIDAKDALSVQVHPSDAYARAKGEADSGKSEMWYVLKPPADGHLIIGLKPGVTRESLAAAYENGTVERCLNRLRVREGDIVNIPAGLVHALTPGAIVAEVQQNSDITYRLYDYNRLGADGQPRPLHVRDALAVADFRGEIPKSTAQRGGANLPNGVRHRVITGEYFTVDKYVLTRPLPVASAQTVFSVLTCAEGRVLIEKPNAPAAELPAGRSAFIPAMLGDYIIRPMGESAIILRSEPICPSPHNI